MRIKMNKPGNSCLNEDKRNLSAFGDDLDDDNASEDQSREIKSDQAN